MSKAQYAIEYGERLRRRRTDAGMSQVQLADAVKVSASALSSWERGIAVPDAWTSRQLRRFFKQKQAAQDAAARAFAAQQYAQSIAKVSA